MKNKKPVLDMVSTTFNEIRGGTAPWRSAVFGFKRDPLTGTAKIHFIPLGTYLYSLGSLRGLHEHADLMSRQ